MLNLLFADGGATVGIIMSVVAAVIILLVILIALATRYKKCPSDKIMVIFGSGLGKTKDGKKRSSLCMHGGARLVWPFFQNFSYMDLTPISILSLIHI
mgnify:FL=1